MTPQGSEILKRLQTVDMQMPGDRERRAGGPDSDQAGFEALNTFGAVDAGLSVLLFIGVNSAFGLPWAIAAATAWSLIATLRRRSRGLQVGWYLPVVTTYLIVRGVVGIAFDSEAVYFGIGIATKALIGVGLIVSVIAGRPIVGEFIHFVIPFPPDVRAHPIYHKTMGQLTLVAAAYELLSSVWDVWLYNNASLNGFLIVRLLAGWLSAFVTISACIVYANRQLSRIPSFDGLLALFEPSHTDPEEKA